MILHRLKIAIRLMLRQRFFTVLNILGLAIGAGCFLMIFLFIQDELSYDKFHEKSSDIYRVNMTNIWVESNDVFGSTSPGVSLAIKENIPEVKKVLRVHSPYGNGEVVQFKNQLGELITHSEEDFFCTDPEFLSVFTFPLKKGNPETALNEPNSILITEEMERKYFGDESGFGKSISIGLDERKKTFRITGILKDIPDQSHFHFNFLASINSFPYIKNRETAWIWTTFVTYVLLDRDADIDVVNQKLAALPAKYVGQEEAEQKNWTLALHPIEDIRLGSAGIPNRFGATGNIQYIWIFGGTAFIILLLSIVNFVNLSTARFAKRVREIGIQKVLGSSISSLKAQFILESLLLSFVAVVIGFGLAESFRAPFNQLALKNLTLNLFTNPSVLLVLLGLSVGIGLLSGIYPAWFMTRVNMVDSLKGKFGHSSGKNTFRNALIVFQFSIAIALIGSTLLVKRQLTYLSNQELGFDKENVIFLPHLEWMSDGGNLFQNELQSKGILRNSSISNSVPPRMWNQERLTPLQSKNNDDLAVTCTVADHQFAPTLGLSFVSGRNFFDGNGDKHSIIINENAAIKLGWIEPNDPIDNVLGKQLSWYGESIYTVIGVVKDFNFWSLNSPIEPLAIFHPDAPVYHGNNRFLLGRINANNLKDYQSTISEIESTWRSINPNMPFEYSFLDQEFDKAFKGQERFGTVLDVFTVLAIFITVLGLIGLISFMTEMRSKEFGVRKVLGASFTNLMKLLSWDFIKLFLIASVFGISVSWYYGQQWLQRFVYQTSLSPFLFIIAGATVLFIVILINWIILTQHSRQNPVISLRDE